MSKYTYEQVHDALVAVVAEKGANYVYPLGQDGGGDYAIQSCAYYTEENGKLVPSCIVGAVLNYLDKRWALRRIKAKDANTGIGVSGVESIAFGHEGALFDYDTRAALTAAQGEQDSGSTWGVALKSFEDLYAKRTSGALNA